MYNKIFKNKFTRSLIVLILTVLFLGMLLKVPFTLDKNSNSTNDNIGANVEPSNESKYSGDDDNNSPNSNNKTDNNSGANSNKSTTNKNDEKVQSKNIKDDEASVGDKNSSTTNKINENYTNVSYDNTESYSNINKNDGDNGKESGEPSIIEQDTTFEDIVPTTGKENYDNDVICHGTLSNKKNYKNGYYESYGAKYVEEQGCLCLKSKKKVTNDYYYVSINDGRLFISINEYDSTGKWIKNAGVFNSGDKYTKSEKAAYITINLKSNKWGVDIWSLFDLGLSIDMSESKPASISQIDYKESYINNYLNWSQGSYSTTTGEKSLEEYSASLNAHIKIDESTYVVKLPSSALKMNIVEMNSNGKVINSSTIDNGKKWTKKSGTHHIAISIVCPDKSLPGTQIIGGIKSYEKTGLKKYQKTTVNSTMKTLTASNFVGNVMNVGINVGNSLDSKASQAGKDKNLNQETNWGNPYITKELFEYIKSSGFNTVRIPVTWYYNSYVENGHRKIGNEWLDRVAEVVNNALDSGLYVILNTHHEQPMFYAGVDNTTFSTVNATAKDIWTEIATYFKGYDEHLIFESYNEIDNIERSWNFGETAASQMNTLNQTFVDAVRATGGNNNKRLLVIPTLLDGTKYKFLNAFKMPKDSVSDRIIVTVHTYVKKFGQDIDGDFKQLELFSDKIGAPIIIGEFGTTTSYPISELRTKHASNFVARAKDHGIKCVYWDNGSDYGIINRKSFSASNTDMIKALIAGANGTKYVIANEIKLNSMDYFDSGSINNSTGDTESCYWGTLVTNENKKGIKVKDKKYIAVSLNVSGGAADVWLQRIAFYDSNGKIINQATSGNASYVKELQMVYYTAVIPSGAAYVRISINSPYENIKKSAYEQYIKDSSIDLRVYFFNTSDVTKK